MARFADLIIELPFVESSDRRSRVSMESDLSNHPIGPRRVWSFDELRMSGARPTKTNYF